MNIERKTMTKEDIGQGQRAEGNGGSMANNGHSPPSHKYIYENREIKTLTKED